MITRPGKGNTAENFEATSVMPAFKFLDTKENNAGTIFEHILETHKGHQFVVVSFLREEQGVIRQDVSVSSMVECNLRCGTCINKGKFKAMLTKDEIAGSVRLAIEYQRSRGLIPRKTVVGTFGSGNPLGNKQHVFPAIEETLKDPTLAIDYWKVSTPGMKPETITELADLAVAHDKRIRLQFSLMSAIPEHRDVIIPPNFGGSLEECLPRLLDFAKKTGNRVDVNALLIKGLTDSTLDAAALAQVTNDNEPYLRAKVSGYNPIPGEDFETSDPEREALFLSVLVAHGVTFKRFIGVEDVEHEMQVNCGQVTGTRSGVRQALKGAL